MQRSFNQSFILRFAILLLASAAFADEAEEVMQWSEQAVSPAAHTATSANNSQAKPATQAPANTPAAVNTELEAGVPKLPVVVSEEPVPKTHDATAGEQSPTNLEDDVEGGATAGVSTVVPGAAEQNPVEVDDAALSSDERAFKLPPMALGLRLGTMGLGLELAARYDHMINARVLVNTGDLKFEDKTKNHQIDGETRTEDSHAEISFSSLALLVDYHFLQSAARLTAGLMLNQDQLDVRKRGYIANREFNGRHYDIDGTASGSVDISAVQPYVGIGWGRAIDEGQRWTFTADLGLLLGLNADVAIDVAGQATDLQTGDQFDVDDTDSVAAQTFQNALRQEIRQTNSDLNDILFFPSLSIGLNYRLY